MAIIDTTKDLTALFAQQVQATPDGLALEDEGVTLTYAQLDEMTEKLASRLRNHGVGRDSLVGILLQRSADYIIACIAALKAGGAFLVLELAYPTGLLSDVIDDAKPVVIITSTIHRGKIKAGMLLILLDKPNECAQVSTAASGVSAVSLPLPDEDDLERLAFVSYSSGTTGRPKGIANPHRAPVRSYDLRFALSDLRPSDRVACNVFFVWEMLRPLLRGAVVVAVPDEASYDPVALVNLLSSRRITETLMTPTLLSTVLARHPALGDRLPELRTLWLNGEVVKTDLARQVAKALPKVRLLNCYSASETHEIACGDIFDMFSDDNPVCPVGPPMDPDHTYILDENGQKVEDGSQGELFVGGNLLARGYLNLPATTAKAFLPDPFSSTPGARMYRTGDTARLLSSGYIEITGRVGAMIKIRGYTVQPGAVENTIMRHLAVGHCAVVVHGDGLERKLVAYIVRDEEDDLRGRAVPVFDKSGHSPAARRVLAEHLAHYMIPSVWVELGEIPTHEVSGKADLKRLPPPVQVVVCGRNSPASKTGGRSDNDTEIDTGTIAEMWAACLGVDPSAVAPEHDFFDLGGHSLALANLASRLNKTFGVTVPIGRLIEDPTLHGHLEAVRSAHDGENEALRAGFPAVLEADSILPDDIKPVTASFRPLKEARTVLLTGTTGFLGAFLLNDILESTSAQVICLVRFNDPSEDDRPAVARLRKNLLQLGLWKDSVLDRVEILPADLGHERFGLSTEAFEALASRTEVIVHAAATVNLVYPYAALRDTNVRGTREIIHLACLSGATVHHVSTNGVLPPSIDGWPESAMIDVGAVPTKLLDGYSQTKWVAEQLVLEAARRGLPARIYRPGTIGGHSVSGATNEWDLLTALLVESLNLGCAPDVEGWYSEMTPVDFVSRAITSLASDGSICNGSVFHLGDPKPLMAKTLFQLLSEIGYRTKPLSWDEWSNLWAAKRGTISDGKSIFTTSILRGGMPTPESLRPVIVLDDTETRPILSKLGIHRPKIDAALLETYTRAFFAHGWLPRPPSSLLPTTNMATAPPHSPLHGRVAIVTGASSGIGAAIATALAHEGCAVALAARRAPRLDDLRTRLAAAHPGARLLAHPTDVTSHASVSALVAATTAQLGPPDMLVCAAGVMYYTAMASARVAEWERTIDVNCKGVLYCLAAVVPGMVARGGGHVVAVSSDAGRKVFPGLGVYSASKFFVEAALQALRVETAGTGLRVTSVQPGNTETELLGHSVDEEAMKKYGAPSGAKVLDPEDVAGAVVYALRQPAHVAVNEVLIEPRDEPI